MTVALEDLFASFVDPVIVIDRSGIVLSANRSACSMFGWEPTELIGSNVSVLMAEPYRSEHDDYIAHYLETGEKRAIGRVRQVVGRRRNGQGFPCELSVSTTTDQSGEQLFLGIVRDVSEREALSARLAQVERLAAMGELAAGIAHEVNNPVNTIINCAQLYRSGDTDPALLDDIVQEGMRIATIVRDLLDLASDRKGEFAPVDMGHIVQRTLSLVSRRLERQGIALSSEIEPNLPPVSGLTHQLQQVLLNLVLNARDALIEQAESRSILVRARTVTDADSSPWVSVTVRDNGPGVTDGDRERIFDPFFTTKRPNAGTGLGLAVSRGIVQDHNGTLNLQTRVGEFAEFEMRVPVIGDPA